jgi:hypothetical protein
MQKPLKENIFCLNPYFINKIGTGVLHNVAHNIINGIL